MNQGREEVSVPLEHEQADAPVDVNERRDERVVVSNAPAIETHDRVLEHDRDNEDNDDEDVALVSTVTTWGALGRATSSGSSAAESRCADGSKDSPAPGSELGGCTMKQAS